jgi:cytochrome c biogenesis protein CcdA
VLRLIGIVISIGLADSLNPSTIGPALYFATGERARDRVAEFTLAVFAVYFVGGAAILVGAGSLIRSFLPHPHHHVTYAIEVGVGVAMVGVAGMLWRYRRRLSQREPPDFDPHGRSSWVLGASITAVELPTAFPYFAALAAIVGADLDVVRDLILLVLFNVCFVLPLLGIVATLTFLPGSSDRLISIGRDFLQRHWPAVLAGVALIAGVFVILLGVSGLASSHSRFFRRLHRTLRG